MNPWQNTIFIFRLGLDDYLMMITSILQSFIPGPAIRSYPCAGGNVVGHEWYQFFCSTSGNYLQPKPPQSSPFSLNGNGHGKFVLGTTTFFTSYASKVKLVYFEIARKLFSSRADRAATELLQPLPSSFITSQTEQLLQVDSIYARLSGAEPPQRLKPRRQWLSRRVKDGSCCYRLMVFTGTANIEPSGAFPVTGISTPGTRKSSRPSKSKKIFKASWFIGEASIKFQLVLWEVFGNIKFVHLWPPCTSCVETSLA